MSRKKTLKELTIKDNFMFGAVMADEENCRLLLERILGFPIERVEVSKERSIFYHPEYKGVRLDIFTKGEKNTCYNVEMQAVLDGDLSKRTRYYHSQIDMELLLSGEDYYELPNAYVIFICDFDPFGKGLYQYSFENKCKEDVALSLVDGSVSIFLNTRGKNEGDVPKGLVRFLDFVRADLEESTNDFNDEFIKRLQQSVQNVKLSREMETKYMLYELTLRKERQQGHAEGKAEGKAEFVLDILSDYGEVPDELRNQILSETDLETLGKWFRLAISVDSVEQFCNKM